MTSRVRLIQPSDGEELRKFYERFALNFVGIAKREARQFKHMARKRDNLRWVALNGEGKIIGYILAAYAKGRRTGRITEIIVDPKYDFETVAGALVDKVHDVFLEKCAAQIRAGGVQNPDNSKIFRRLGFWHIKTDGVFMYAITDAAQFLSEITPILVKRLKTLSDWNGQLRVSCENHQISFKKEGETVQSSSLINDQLNCDIFLKASGLIRVLLGSIDVQSALLDGLITVKTDLPKVKMNELLLTIFPKKQFLTFDYW